MKTILFFITLFFSLNKIIICQWLEHHIIPNGIWAGRAEFVYENICWGVMGFSTGAEGFFRTSDGGNSWYYDSLATNIFAIHPRSDNIAYIATNDSLGLGKIIKTIDGGENWIVQNSAFFEPVTFIDYIYFFDDHNGFALADPNLTPNYFEIYTTTDAGENWTKVPLTNIPQCFDNEFCNNLAFSVVDDNIFIPLKINGEGKFRIFKSIDKGYTWTVTSECTTALPTSYPMSIAFNNSMEGILIFSTLFSSGFSTSNYQIFKTIDGGNSWEEVNFSLPIDPAFISTIPGTTAGYFLCAPINNTGTAYTLDGGSNWIQVDSRAIWDIDFQSPSEGWAFDFNLPIIYKWTGNLVSVEENLQISNSYKLEQNYPNPFNPTTKIKYTIPQKVKSLSTNVETQNIASVQLKIYDILGSEVATLVNQNQKPGNYEVEFDGSNLPSGVYFYKLQADEFTETKKMILLR